MTTKYWVIPDGDGTFYVTEGSEAGKRAAVGIPTEMAAVATARGFLHNKGGGQVVVKGEDGKIKYHKTVEQILIFHPL